MITEENFLPFFQKEISIVLDNKTLRQGKLLLLSIKDFYLHFTLLHNNVKKNFELPYPFRAYVDDSDKNILILDYKIKSFTRNLSEIDEKARLVKSKDKHMKYYDSYVKVVETY